MWEKQSLFQSTEQLWPDHRHYLLLYVGSDVVQPIRNEDGNSRPKWRICRHWILWWQTDGIFTAWYTHFQVCVVYFSWNVRFISAEVSSWKLSLSALSRFIKCLTAVYCAAFLILFILWLMSRIIFSCIQSLLCLIQGQWWHLHMWSKQHRPSPSATCLFKWKKQAKYSDAGNTHFRSFAWHLPSYHRPHIFYFIYRGMCLISRQR